MVDSTQTFGARNIALSIIKGIIDHSDVSFDILVIYYLFFIKNFNADLIDYLCGCRYSM